MLSEIEDFIAANHLDGRAADALRTCSPEVQQAVVARGTLEGARNPSSAVLGRIKDAQALSCAPAMGLTQGAFLAPAPQPGEVELFIEEHDIDERAADALRNAKVEVQQYVLERGSLKDARNASSALLGRLRDASSAKKKVHIAAEVEAFIAESGVDERAADALRGIKPEVQREVLARGTLKDAQNPSSALLGRLRDCNNAVLMGHTKGGKGYGKDGKGKGAAAAPDAMNPMLGMMQNMMGMMGMKPATPAVRTVTKPVYNAYGEGEAIPTVEEFMYETGLDERAQEALMTSTPEVQRWVIERGSLRDARNPSSALLGRIRDAQQHVVAEADVEAFIAEAALDERASSALRTAPMASKREVLARGSLKDARNPSSACLGRLRDAGQGSGSTGGSSVPMVEPQQMMNMMMPMMEAMMKQTMSQTMGQTMGTNYSQPVASKGNPSPVRTITGKRNFAEMNGVDPMNLENFIMASGLDDRAIEALRTADPAVQAVVLERGSLQDCRNPSSALLGRLRDAQAQVSSGAGGSWGSAGGSWSSSGGSWGSADGSPGNSWGGPWGGQPFSEVEAFIAASGLDERAADAMRTATPQVQRAVMGKGGLQDCRNPSSALLGRLRDASSNMWAAGGGGGNASNMMANNTGNMMAAMMSSMTGAMKGAPMQHTSPGGGYAKVENFIMMNGLDERAADALRSCNPQVQNDVMARGNLQDARNPSSAVLARIRDAQSGRFAMGKGPSW